MLVSKARTTTRLFKNSLLSGESTGSLGIIRNVSPNNQLFFVHKKFKNTSSEEKKHSEEKPKKPRTLAKLATAAVVGTTVAVIAAKYDDDFRDWSKEHIPVLDNLVKIIFQEEDTYLETLDKAHKAISAWIKNAVYELFKAVEEKPKKGVVKPSDDKIVALPLPEPCEEGKKLYKPPESAFLVKGGDEKQDSAKPGQAPKELKELRDLEENVSKVVQETIQNLALTACALREHSKLIDYLDQIINSGNHKVYDRIKRLRDDVTKGLDKIEVNAAKLEALLQQLVSKLEDNPSLSNDAKAKAQENLKTVQADVSAAVKNKDKAVEQSVLAKRNWAKVKQARLHFSEELETLFPNVWLNDEKMNIPADQLDPFTEKVLSELEGLDRQLAKIKLIFDTQLNSALDRYKNKDPEAIDEIADVLVPYEISKEKKKKETELQKNMLAHKAKCEKNAKALMKQTTEVYADLTAEALKLKEKEVERKMQQQLEEKLAQARAEQKLEIAKMVGRMQGANEAIAKRGEKDKSQQEKQQFWSAAQSLMAAVKPIGAAAQVQEPKPLKNEIANLTKVKPEKDELVDNVLKTIPEEAVEKGVPSEAALRERFMKVMSSARGWAGVPPGEVTLLQILLARVQSALYLNTPIPQSELDNEPAIDPEKLNNYDVLQRAKYYVERGEFDQAIRYLNLLKGPAAKIASDWVKDALVYLETRQAAELLLAHATAAGMTA